MIEAYLVVDEEDEDGVSAVKIRLCKYCHEDLCVWEQHMTSVESWAKRKLRCEPGFTMGQTSLNNCKKCFVTLPGSYGVILGRIVAESTTAVL
jgi:hypothetical protein